MELQFGNWMRASTLLDMYRQASNTRCTKSQHLDVSRLVLNLPNPLKPGVMIHNDIYDTSQLPLCA